MGPPKQRNETITHLFFVDDLKLLGGTERSVKKQLDAVTKFSNDIGMQFGQDKCAYICIEGGKRKSRGEEIDINGVKIRELGEEKTYKYLGIDESVRFDSSLNKSNITTEYKRRLRKIWSSELNASNKIVATNTFAVPVLSYSFGILDWTNAEIKGLDITTRKVMNIHNALHRRSDVDRLYIARRKGGRGLKNIEDEYLAKVVAFTRHLSETRNRYLQHARMNERDKLLALSRDIMQQLEIDPTGTPKQVAKQVKSQMEKLHIKQWREKSIHGNYIRDIEANNINQVLTWNWMQPNTMTASVESFVFMLQDQELNTRDIQKFRCKDRATKQGIDARCRLCHKYNETVSHILAGCPSISPNLYLNDRHNPVAKVVYDELLQQYGIDSGEPKTVKNDKAEIWWDEKITMPVAVPHNKPDIVVWDLAKKTCAVIDISVPLDINVNRKCQEKRNAYAKLVSELQRVYREYKYRIVPVVVGALGAVPEELPKALQELGMKNKWIMRRIQQRALIGSMKIAATAMKMA